MKKIQLLSNIFFAVTASGLFAQPGALDPAFGSAGKLTTNIGKGDDQAVSAVLQPDGKIVVAGYAYNGADYDVTVARFNADGALDEGFAQNGMVHTDIDFDNDLGRSVALQPDGKIVVAGRTSGSFGFAFAVLRYTAEGLPDTCFGTGGIVTTDVVMESTDYGYAVAVQPDGKIVVAGGAWGGKFAVVRYNADGTLDVNFGNDGIATAVVGNAYDAYNMPYALALQPDGKILVAGSANNGANLDFAVVRFNADGALDPGFGTNGQLSTSFAYFNQDYNDIANALALQPDGKILVAGKAQLYGYYSNFDFAVARYTADGVLDTSFHGNGKNTVQFNNKNAEAYSIVVQPDGKIVLAGVAADGAKNTFAMARLIENGNLDPTFGQSGLQTTSIGSSNAVSFSAILQPDGNIVLAGYAFNGSDNDCALARYDSDGYLDNQFGTNGTRTIDLKSRSNNFINSIAIQPDGKIIAAGVSNTGERESMTLARYTPGGALDAGFGAAGVLKTTVNYGAVAVALQADGKIVTTNSESILRYLPDGTPDSSFANNGVSSPNFYIDALAIQPDGKIVAGGAGDDGFSIMRFNPDGSVDSPFEINGVPWFYSQARSVVVQPDGKIVACGPAYTGTEVISLVVRYNADGSKDNSFALGGILTIYAGAGYFFDARAIALQPDGKMVVAGSDNDGAKNRFVVVRCNPDGSFDDSFGIGGMFNYEADMNSFAFALTLQADGKILVAGTSAEDFAVIRCNTNGMLDSTFHEDGIVTTDIGTGSDDRALSMALQSDGKIVVAGASASDFAVVRYLTGLNVGVLDFSVFDQRALIYPNPVEKQATLEYGLTDAAVISIRLLDAQGRTLETFLTGAQQPAGRHQQAITLPAGLPPGHYYIVLDAGGNKRLTVKIVK